MLYVCAGMEKGGTTYTYNLTKLVLAEAGFPYVHLERHLRGDPSAKERPANNIWSWAPEIVENLRNADRDGAIVALRTHEGPSQEAIDLLNSTGGKAHIAIRDPRDLALSLIDMSRIVLEKGRSNRAGIEVDDITTTFAAIRTNVDNVTRWKDATDCIVLYYEDTAFRPEVSIRALCDQLGLVVPAGRFAALAEEAGENQDGKRNVAQPLRHKREMDEATQALFLDEFRPFYERFFPDALR